MLTTQPHLNAEVKNEWNYSCTLLYAFVAWTGTNLRLLLLLKYRQKKTKAHKSKKVLTVVCYSSNTATVFDFLSSCFCYEHRMYQKVVLLPSSGKDM
jgi:hypothetical protein